MGKEEFSGIRIHDRRTNDFTVDLGRNNNIFANQGLIQKAILIDKSLNAVQRIGNDLDNRLQYVLVTPSLHNGMTSIKIQQQINSLPGGHVKLMNQLDSGSYGTGRDKRLGSFCV